MILIDKISHIEETGLERLCDLPWITQLEVTKPHYMFDILCWVTSCFLILFPVSFVENEFILFPYLIASFLRRVARSHISPVPFAVATEYWACEIAYQILLN